MEVRRQKEWPIFTIMLYVFPDFSKYLNLTSTTTSTKCSRKAPVNVDRILLGPLTKDIEFLKGLSQKLVTKKKDLYGDEVPDTRQDEVYTYKYIHIF